MEYLEDCRDESDWRTVWNVHQAGTPPNSSVVSLQSLQNSLFHISSSYYLSSPSCNHDINSFFNEMVVLFNQHYLDGEESGCFDVSQLQWALLADTSTPPLLTAIRDASCENKMIAFIAASTAVVHVNNEVPDWLQDFHYDDDEDFYCPQDVDHLEGDVPPVAASKESSKPTKEVGIVEYIFVRKDRQGQGLCPLLFQALSCRLAQRGIHGVIEMSDTSLSHVASSTSTYFLPLNMPKLQALGLCPQQDASECTSEAYRDLDSEVLAAFKPLEERHLTSALQLLNTKAKESAVGIIFRDELHLKHIFLTFPEIVVAFVKEEEDNAQHVTDLVSFCVLSHRIHTSEISSPDPHLTFSACLYYSVAKTVSIGELMQVVTIKACDDFRVDCLHILPLGMVHEADCLNLRVTEGSQSLYYYCNTHVGIRRNLHSQELFIFPNLLFAFQSFVLVSKYE